MHKAIAAAAAALVFATASAAQPAEGAWVRPDLQRLVQSTNEKRFEALKALLDERGLEYEVHAFAGSKESGGVSGRNLVVTLGDGDRDIVLGAHYDAEKLADGRLVEGVVDNGASVVALVRAAEALSARDLKHRVRVIFWDQEELGLLGSKAWLAQTDRARIAASVNFDVNGFGDTVIYGGMKSDRAGLVRGSVGAVCARRALDCVRFDTFPPSDDIPFADAGIPVVSMGIQPAADAHQLWLLMHRGKESGLAPGVVPRVFTTIHTPADNMSAIEPTAVDLASRLAVDMVAELDAKL